MPLQSVSDRNALLSLVSIAILSGFVVYLILSFLLIPERMSIPFAIIISVLLFGLINYYSVRKNFPEQKASIVFEGSLDKFLNKSAKSNYEDKDSDSSSSNLSFILLYIVSLVIVVLGPHANSELFLPWDEISLAQIIQLTAALLLSFFAPGYAILSILFPKEKLNLLPKILLAYILSIFITAIATYVTASIGVSFPTTSNVIITINALIFTSFVVFVFLTTRRNYTKKIIGHQSYNLLFPYSNLSISTRPFRKWMSSVGKSGLELIVFGSLIAMVVLSTYVLYGGIIIGDQWFHHGRALSFMSGTFYEASLSDEHLKDPPFFPAFLAGFFSMSGLPTVNAYAAIDFFNIVPVFAFYYFFSRWVADNRRKAALLASVLFMLSSGFGWLYLLYLAGSDQEFSERASLDDFNDARIKSFDIFQPSSFVSVDHPGITSPLIMVALPAGFVLLGLISKKEAQKEVMGNILRDLVIVSVICLAGALAHPEFYLFLIIASILALVYRLPRRNHIFLAFIISIALTILIDRLPGQYFSSTLVIGVPLTYLSLIFVALAFTLSIFATRISGVKKMKKTKKMRRPQQRGRLTFPISIALASFLAYFYIFTFVVWGELSLQDVRLQTVSDGQQEIPWYLYPIKLGTCGLIGLFYLVSYLFRPFKKEIFVFAIISVVALFTGTYYDEHRFSKYIMVGLVGLAAIAIYNIIITVFMNQRNKIDSGAKSPLIIIGIIISLTVVSASMSSILYTGYSALAIDNHYRPFERDLPKRYFPTDSEIALLRFIYNDLIDDGRNYNVVTSPEEYDIRQHGLTGKIEAFVGIPANKLLQGQSVLQASTLKKFFELLNDTETKLIVLPKEDITSKRNNTSSESSVAGSADTLLVEPARFALSNFKKAYEDNDYVVLSVPDDSISIENGSSILKLDEKENPETRALELSSLIRFPGDISERAKRDGIQVPLQKAMGSEINIIAAALIPAIAFILGKRLTSRRAK